jgi:23S rRNA (cytidine1920-2'-O)/16S rRNA (cytidine1409-2'-O)-methyltransferase
MSYNFENYKYLEQYFQPQTPPSRSAVKLAAAMQEFECKISGKICGDFGCNSGGFTAVLLNCKAQKIYSVESGYGVLDWSLRNHPSVVCMERTNAMHIKLAELCDFIVVDTSWTRQIKILPNVIKNLQLDGKILTLIKPHYEATGHQIRQGKLEIHSTEEVLNKVQKDIENLGLKVLAKMACPILGKQAGNQEYFWYLELDQTQT